MGQEDKKNRYERPELTSYESDSILKAIGPAQGYESTPLVNEIDPTGVNQRD